MRLLAVSTASALLALGFATAGCGGDGGPSAESEPPAATAPTETAAPATTPAPPTTAAEPEPASPPTPDLAGLDASDATLIDGYLGWTELTKPPIASLRELGAGAHRGVKRIWASPPAEELRADGAQRFPYPRGTVVVKEGRSGGAVTLIAIMEKVRANDPELGGWRYVEYTRPAPDGTFTKVGFPESGCAGCHQNANTAQKTDWVFYSLP